MKQRIVHFRSDENGATAVEYALVILAVALALVGALPTFRSRLADIFNSIISGWI